MAKIRYFGLFLFCIIFIVSGCAKTAPNPTELPTIEQPDLMKTSVSLVTLAAGQTLAAEASATPTPTLAFTPIPTQIATIARSSTPEPEATSSVDCNRASPGTPFDLTIPDNTKMYAGQEFTKTWRLVNTGSCKWTRLYKLVFFSQNAMGAMQEQHLTGEVLPGQAIDLSVTFFAPSSPGLYQSNWMLQDPDGNLFGIGPNADGPFYVRIEVTQDPSPTSESTLTLTPNP